MKSFSSLLGVIVLAASLFQRADAAEPKKLLVIGMTASFYHTSIPTLTKVLEQLGKSSGEFTVDIVQEAPPQGGGRGRRGGGATNTVTPEQQQQAAQAAQAARDHYNATMKAGMDKLSPQNLKNYDAVVFASTTGDLQIPDKQGLLDWIKAGHAFIGIHAASDTLHHWPEYLDMLGGEFDHHGQQLSVDVLNQDEKNPATAGLPKVWTIAQEEVYQFKSYDPAKVHELLIMDKRPEGSRAEGHYAVSWCKSYGEGRVFYTSLGHREDLIDTDPNIPQRRNDVEAAKTYQKHILGGIEWALKLKN